MTTTFSKALIAILLVSSLFGVVAYVTNTSLFTNEAVACCGDPGGPSDPGGPGDDPGGPGDPTPPTPPTCNLSLDVTEVANIGDSYRLEWVGTPDSASFFINGTEVDAVGHANFTFTGPNYDRFRLVGNNGGVTCQDDIEVTRIVTLPPTCDLFTVDPEVLPAGGGTVTLEWETTGATLAEIDGQRVAGSGTWDYDGVVITDDRTFTLELTNSEGTANCTASVTVEDPTPAPVCNLLDFQATPNSIVRGESIVLSWTNPGTLTILELVRPNSTETLALDATTANASPFNDHTFTLRAGNNSGTVECTAPVTVSLPTTPAISIIKRDAADADDTQTVAVAGTANFEIIVTNTGNEDLVNVQVTDPLEPACNHTVGALAVGQSSTPFLCSTTNVQAAFTNVANVTGDSAVDGETVTDTDPTEVLVNQVGTPVCSVINFQATPSTIVRGEQSVLTWTNPGNFTTLELVRQSGLQVLALDAVTETVAPTIDFNFILRAGNSAGTVECMAPVNVTDPVTPTTPAISIIKRDAADADDTQTVAVAGTANFEIIVTNTGNEDLVNVQVTDPLEPACNHTVGALAVGQSSTPFLCSTTNVQAAFTNVANVTGDSAVDGETVTDTDPTEVLVNTGQSLSCSDISISASDTSVSSNTNVDLTWVVTGNVDSVELDGTAVALNDTQTVTVTNDTTYTFTINGLGDTEDCTISIDTTSGGGGGGGSSSPRCEFDISASEVDRGDTVTLTWDSTRASDLEIVDDQGNVIVTTKDKLSDEKDELYDGEIEVEVTRDTTYTLTVERGSRDRECEVDVAIEGGGSGSVLLQTRDQAPLVSGILLTQVPHTGFEAGPLMTTLFYIMITAWALFLTYVFFVPKKVPAEAVVSKRDYVAEAETLRPDVFAAIPTPVVASVATAAAPTNLPVAPIAPASVETIDTVALEAIAHANHTLLSTDALATFVANVPAPEQQQKLVNLAIAAKALFPLEDGWVVVNNDRMMALLSA